MRKTVDFYLVDLILIETGFTIAYALRHSWAILNRDPRYELVRSVYGERTLDKWQDLNGRWAVPGNSYGQSILSMFRAIVNE